MPINNGLYQYGKVDEVFVSIMVHLSWSESTSSEASLIVDIVDGKKKPPSMQLWSARSSTFEPRAWKWRLRFW